jgi:hypothetical protein
MEMIREVTPKGVRIHEMEREWWSRMLSVGRAILEGFVDRHGKAISVRGSNTMNAHFLGWRDLV